jgi:hypothetical protein
LAQKSDRWCHKRGTNLTGTIRPETSERGGEQAQYQPRNMPRRHRAPRSLLQACRKLVERHILRAADLERHTARRGIDDRPVGEGCDIGYRHKIDGVASSTEYDGPARSSCRQWALMAAKVKRPRRYDSARRQDAAQRRRAAVVEAASRLFVREGFAGTTIARIAEDAGVSVETVYKAFGNKIALVRAIRDKALAGEGPVHAERRSDRMQASEHDPRKIVRGWVS